MYSTEVMVGEVMTYVNNIYRKHIVLIINSMINRKMIAFLSYSLKNIHYHSEKKLEDTSSPSKIRDYNR